MLLTDVNLDPFWRTSVGFDRLFDLMDESLRFNVEVKRASFEDGLLQIELEREVPE